MIFFAITVGGRPPEPDENDSTPAPEGSNGSDDDGIEGGAAERSDLERRAGDRRTADRQAGGSAKLLSSSLQQLEQQLAEREEFIAVQHAELETAIDTIRTLKTEREDGARRVAHLEATLERRKERIAKLKRRLESGPDAAAATASDGGAMPAMAISAPTDEATNESGDELTDGSIVALAEPSADQADYAAAAELAEQELTLLREQLQAMAASLDAEQRAGSELQVERDAAREQLVDVEQELQQLRADAQAVTTLRSKLAAQQDAEQEAGAALEQAQGAQQQATAELQARLQETTAALDAARAAQATLDEERSELVAALQKEQAATRSAREAAEAEAGQSQALEESVALLRERARGAEQECVRLQAELDARNQEETQQSVAAIERLEHDLAERDAVIAELEQRLENKRTQITEMRSSGDLVVESLRSAEAGMEHSAAELAQTARDAEEWRARATQAEKIAERAVSRMEFLEADLAGNSDQITNLQNALLATRQELHATNHQFAQRGKEREAELQERIATLSAALQDSTASLQQAENQQAVGVTAAKAQREKIAELEQSLSERRADSVHFAAPDLVDSEVLDEALARIRTLESEAEARAAMVETLDRMVNERTRTAAALEARIGDRDLQISTLESAQSLQEVRVAGDNMAAFASQAAGEVATLRFELRSKIGIADALESIAAQESNRLLDYQQSASACHDRIQQLRTLIAQRVRTLDELRRDREDWRSSIAPLEATLSERDGMIAAAHAGLDIDDLTQRDGEQGALAAMASSVRRWRETVNPLRTTLRDRNANISALQDKLSRRDAELEELRRTLATWMHRVTPLRATLVARAAKIARMQSQIQDGTATPLNVANDGSFDELPAVIESTDSEVQTSNGSDQAESPALPDVGAESNVIDLRRQVDEHGRSIERLESALSDLTDKLEEAGEDLRKSRQQVGELESSLRDHDESVASMHEELESWRIRARALAAEIDIRDRTLARLKPRKKT